MDGFESISCSFLNIDFSEHSPKIYSSIDSDSTYYGSRKQNTRYLTVDNIKSDNSNLKSASIHAVQISGTVKY
jgi:hypothetical protein